MRRDDYVTTRPGERRRIKRLQILCHTSVSFAQTAVCGQRAGHSFTSTPFGCRCQRCKCHGSPLPRQPPPPHSPLLLGCTPPIRELQRQACGPQSTGVAGRLFLKFSGKGASSVGRYSTMLDSQRLPRHKQLIQLGGMAVHWTSQRHEALPLSELLCCKQADGESFPDFLVRLKNLAEEVALCTGNAVTCAEIQLKMVLLMGVRDEELIQRLISLDTGASLQEVVTVRSLEATRQTASAIYSSPKQLRVMSTYKKRQAHDKTPHSPQQPTSGRA
ncbi:hypothetical protein GWK47_023771 [Chionoecetes opilio]|uniref:Uncharacterized protein n=1 Tax=Chionoecetes opilio TaxID=41210 RepID=A0A8J4XM27_CHIOP|nr:hypothetical protein GWK47_023771 [Chionoecetes opilio]